MKRLLTLSAIALLATSAHADPPKDYHLVWSDEFDTGAMPDPAK